MVTGSERELYKSKLDQRGIGGRREMANLVLITKCENWVQGSCAKKGKLPLGWQSIFFARNVKE